MISLGEAQAFVLERVRPLPPRRVALAEALGLVLAEVVRATEAIPPFASSAMDGFAVRAVDVAAARPDHAVRLPVVAEVAAGHPVNRALAAGEAMRIFTGAPMPAGADAVVMVEHTVAEQDRSVVGVLEAVPAGLHVRDVGGDVQPGDEVFQVGEVVTPGHLGVLASIGASEVVVVPRPRVGVLSTGDELVPAGQPLGPGQIRDSNRLPLVALLGEAGMVPVDLGVVRDDEAAITEAIEAGAASCDALITSGGVSMGDIDLVKVVLDRIGDLRWMQIAIRPAKPFAFGTVGDRGTPVFGLPGNPVSSMVSFELLARPGLRRLAGHASLHQRPVRASAAEDFPRRPDGKTHYVRVGVAHLGDGSIAVRSAGQQGSHQLTAMARADGLLVLPDGDGVRAGDTVDVLLLHDARRT